MLSFKCCWGDELVAEFTVDYKTETVDLIATYFNCNNFVDYSIGTDTGGDFNAIA